MATLLLVRHAQASFFGPTYDRLTEHGRRQARLLGQHWLSTGIRPRRLVIGPLVCAISVFWKVHCFVLKPAIMMTLLKWLLL